jgi:hypothetical protein
VAHYTRQSYGIARAYQRTTTNGARPDRLTTVVLFAFPAWGLLHRAHQHPAVFYGAPLYSPPVPKAAVTACGAIALCALAAWIVHRMRASGASSIGHDLFVLSHVALTTISYVVVKDVTSGWLFVNVWHNAQYLLFVWSANERRFSVRTEPDRPLFTRLPLYVAICLGGSTLFYLALGALTSRGAVTSILPWFLVCHQAVNFHHYLVDAVIWRSKPLSIRDRRLPATARCEKGRASATLAA